MRIYIEFLWFYIGKRLFTRGKKKITNFTALSLEVHSCESLEEKKKKGHWRYLNTA